MENMRVGRVSLFMRVLHRDFRGPRTKIWYRRRMAEGGRGSKKLVEAINLPIWGPKFRRFRRVVARRFRRRPSCRTVTKSSNLILDMKLGINPGQNGHRSRRCKWGRTHFERPMCTRTGHRSKMRQNFVQFSLDSGVHKVPCQAEDRGKGLCSNDEDG
jgi:hypothetical protein